MADLTLARAVELLSLSVDTESVLAMRNLLIAERNVDAPGYGSALTAQLPLFFTALQSPDVTERTKLAVTDALAVWVLRAGTLALKEPQFAEELKDLWTDERLEFLFNYTTDYWAATGAPISNSLKDLFTKLVLMLRRQGGQQRLFENWIGRVLQIQDGRRVKFYLLEILHKELEDHRFIIRTQPDFVARSLRHITTKGLESLIGRCVGGVMKTLYVNEDHAQQWVDVYWGPVLTALRDPELRGSVQHNLLPVLFKVSAASFKIVVELIKDDTELLIACLNIGQLLAIEADEIVPIGTIEELLVQGNYKVKAFQLLTFSAKKSKPINPQVFEILKRNLGLFLVDTEVESRMDFISMLKQFLYRLKDSSYALNRDANKLLNKELPEKAQEKLANVAACKDFLQWIINLIKLLILPGSQYQRVTSGLMILRQLVESNLDPHVPYKVEINYPFQISIFDDVMKRLLLDNIMSTYDDIRSNAVHLLNVSNSEWTTQQKDIIKDRGFEMLQDYTRSDSGAKILEMASMLFRDASIYDRLVSEIPLTSDIKTGVKNPINGYFQAISLILSHAKQGRDVDHLIGLCEQSWSFVKEILSHSSPEGCDLYGAGSGQLVLSYGWRATKESTLLLQQLLTMTLTDFQIRRIGELTLDQLATVRHRGAFSSVYPTFIQIAGLCCTQIPGQNQTWLDANIDLIRTKTQLITRRSGGLPYLITAIVSVDRALVNYAFERLFSIASVPVDVTEESEKMDIPQVHAFNCIKALFIESSLSDCCVPYIYKGLELALSSFSSQIWSVRNCSIMLFTAIETRLFGRKKMSARVFFSRYKGIKAILITILEGGDLETLFPVLTILSKLDSAQGYQLDEFLPLIRKCLAAKHWKIRECASRALPALVVDSRREVLELLADCSIKEQNKLHGYLLALKVLGYIDPDVEQKLFALVVELLVRNPCYATKKSFVDVLALIKIPDSLRLVLKELFIQENSIYEINGSKQLYLQELFKLIVDKDTLSLGLSSSFFEVKLQAIAHCQDRAIDHGSLSMIAKDEEEFTYVRSKAIPLVQSFDVSKLLQFATNQELYGEDIKCSSLQLLGELVASDESHFDEWVQLMKLNSDDDQPFNVRMACLVSCLRNLKVKTSAVVSWFVYQFLTDDDEEIRALAASVFKDAEPWIAAQRFTQSYGKTLDESSVVLSQVLSFIPDFKALEQEKVLFNVEKQNLYRNTIEQHTQLAVMLKNCVLTDGQRVQITKHFSQVKQSLVSLINDKGFDGVLGWSSRESVFEQIYSTELHLQSWELDTTELKEVARAHGLHVALYRYLA